jgi:hypothetical protein
MGYQYGHAYLWLTRGGPDRSDNDFISERGKIWARIKDVAEANDCVPHMLHALNAVRETELGIFYALHHRYRTFLISRINRRKYGNVESRTKSRSSDHEGRTN